MSHTWPLLIGLAITGLLSVPTMNAQEVVGPLPVKTVIRGGAEVSDFRLFPISPNGKYVAYTLSENEFGHRTKDLWANYCRSGVLAWAGRSILRLHNLSTGADVPLTPAGSHDWAPTWSPDGRSLAFYSDREGGLARIWIHDMASGKERKVSDERVLFSGGLIQWTPDASRIVVKTYPRSLTTEACIALESSAFVEDASPTKSDGLTVRVYSSEVAKSGEGRADAWRLESNFFGDLAVIDVAHGGVQRISYPGPGIGLYKLSPDGSLVAFSAPKRFEKASSQQILFDVVIFNWRERKTQVVASDVRLYLGGRPFSWSPDSSRLAYITSALSVNAEAYVLRIDGSKPRRVASSTIGSDYSFQGLLWDRDGRNLYFSSSGKVWRTNETVSEATEVASLPNHRIAVIANGENLDEFRNANSIWSPDEGHSTVVVTQDQQTKRCGFYRINLTSGIAERLLEEDKFYGSRCDADGLNVSPDGKTVIYVAEDAGHEAELWASDSDFRNPKQLTHVNPDFYKYKFGVSRLIQWRGMDGQALKGALLLPADYREGQLYPLVCLVYGGALLSEDLNKFDFDWPIVGTGSMQLFATRGYAVLAVDAPWRPGTPVVDLFKAVIPGVDKAIELRIADPNRIGVMGHSFGGFSALSLIVQTTRFKAAVMSAGFGDQMCAYGGMKPDGTARGVAIAERMLTGGTPWEYRSRFIENSPIFYLDHVATPLLIFHGGDDSAVPPYCADEVFVSLRRLGKTVEYAKYSGEDHYPQYWSIANRTDYINRMLAWFDKYLKVQPPAKGN